MESIVKIHNDVLEHLLNLQKGNKELFFVPRKINNQNRLNRGFWFLGNDYYLIVSFWDGSDTNERVHNINFGVNSDGTSFISLSSQDTNEKVSFLDLVAEKLGGFVRHEDKKGKITNKWFRRNEGNNFIKNLDNFIQNDKPLIDQLIKRNQPTGISLLNDTTFKKYSRKVLSTRNAQKQFGIRTKISRISWNNKGWHFPTGSKGKSTNKDSFENQYGFGYEEWLFDKTKIVDNYHYGFLQTLHIKTDIHVDQVYDIHLYTIHNSKERYYVGKILNVECISKNESRRAFNFYQSKGWISEMTKQVEYVNADYQKFSDTKPESMFNIRFKLSDVFIEPDLIEISQNDPNILTSRFKLLSAKGDVQFELVDDSNDKLKNTNRRKYILNSIAEYDPYHNKMQNELLYVLKASGDYISKTVKLEDDRVDIKAQTHSGEWHFFELKTDTPKLSIRKALGQILEYAYYPNEERASKLIIVSDSELDHATQKYLDLIRDKFNLPIVYKFFNLEDRTLSIDY